MNQKLSDWASIAEILSAIAVVVTLVFLIVGVRENTAVTRAGSFDSSMRGIADFRTLLIGDADIARLWGAFLSGETETLSGEDSIRVRQLLMLAYENMQRAYFARQYNVLGESEWSRFEIQICLQFPRVLADENITRGLQAVLTPEFWNYIQTTCDSQR